MDTKTKQAFIRRIARENAFDPAGRHILWSRHAVTELVNETWRRVWVEAGLVDCEIIEDYPTRTRPLPDCLIMGELPSGEQFHAVIAIDSPQRRLLVVTIYKPSTKEWKHGWRTRKN